MNDHLMIE